MGLFWKRTKKQDAEPSAEQPLEQGSSEEAQQQAEAEQKPGIFKRFFGISVVPPEQSETPPPAISSPIVEPEVPIVRAPEQEKKSFWDRFGLGGDASAQQQAQTPAAEDADKRSIFQRWKASLNRTSENLMSRLEDVVRGKKVLDAEVLDSLEEA